MVILTQTEPDVNGREWGDRIPFLGEVDPVEYDANVGSDPAAMDAEALPFAEWQANFQGGLYWVAGEMHLQEIAWMTGGVWARAN